MKFLRGKDIVKCFKVKPELMEIFPGGIYPYAQPEKNCGPEVINLLNMTHLIVGKLPQDLIEDANCVSGFVLTIVMCDKGSQDELYDIAEILDGCICPCDCSNPLEAFFPSVYKIIRTGTNNIGRDDKKRRCLRLQYDFYYCKECIDG